jgi:hypothetical protein
LCVFFLQEKDSAKKIEALAKNPGIIITDSAPQTPTMEESPSLDKSPEEPIKAKRLSQKSADSQQDAAIVDVKEGKKDIKRKSREVVSLDNLRDDARLNSADAQELLNSSQTSLTPTPTPTSITTPTSAIMSTPPTPTEPMTEANQKVFCFLNFFFFFSEF